MHHLLTPFLVLLALFVAQPAAFAATTKDPVFDFVRARAGAAKAKLYSPLIKTEAARHKLPALLVAKLINRESTFKPDAANGYCAGLMQVDSRLHFKRGESPWVPATNLRAGCKVLASNYKKFGNWPQALTAYNYGPNHRVTLQAGTSSFAVKVLSGK